MEVILVFVTITLTSAVIIGTAYGTYKLITSSIQFEFDENTIIEDKAVVPLQEKQKVSIEKEADDVNKTLDEKLKQW